jgi:hypothetical protein
MHDNTALPISSDNYWLSASVKFTEGYREIVNAFSLEFTILDIPQRAISVESGALGIGILRCRHIDLT